MDHTSNQPQPSERAADMQPSHTHHQPFTSGQHSSTSHSFPHVSEPARSDDVDLYQRRHQSYDDVTIPKQVVDIRDEAGAVATPSSHLATEFKEISGGTTMVGSDNTVKNSQHIETLQNIQQQNKSVNVVYKNCQFYYKTKTADPDRQHGQVSHEHREHQPSNTTQPVEGATGNTTFVNPEIQNPHLETADLQNPDLQKVISILEKDGKVILCTHPGVSREAFTSDLCTFYRRNGFSVYHLSCVSEWEIEGQREKECVVFDRAFGDSYFDNKQYHKYVKRWLYNMNTHSTKLVLYIYPNVLKQLMLYDRPALLLNTVQVVTLDHGHFPLSPQSYTDLFVRMFTHRLEGKDMAAVVSLVMMGQGRFLSNVGQSKPHLERLGFKVLADAELHTYASPLEGFLLAEHGKGFVDRAVYEAAGLALGTAGFQAVLLQVCDVQFLVERVTSSGVTHVNSPVLTLAPDDTQLLMKRILDDLDKGCVAPWVQHPCLHSPEFLRQLDKLCEKEGQLQSVQRVVEHEHSLPLLYWSVWGPTPRLTRWCLSVWHKTQVPDTATVVLKALVVHLLKHAQQQDTPPDDCFTPDHFAQLTQARVGTLSLPTPSQKHRYTDQLKTWCDVIKRRLSGQQCYLKDASLPIPSQVLEIRWTGEVVYLQLPSQDVYLALRLLTDRQVDEQDADGNTVLHLAADTGDVQVVSLALQAGASVTVKNKTGLTPPQLAARRRTRLSPKPESDHKVWFDFNTACGAGDLHTVQRLLCSSLSVDDRSKKGWTSLQYAARCGQTHIASLLLALHADVDGVDGTQQTALHLACQQRHLSMVKLLLTHRADVKALTSHKYSALHVACESGEKEMAAVLLEHEADVNVRCDSGHTPLNLACFNSHWDLAALLVQHGADCNTPLAEGGTDTMLHKACRDGLTQLAHFLLNNQARVDLKTKSGWTALHLACDQGHTECARLLVENGADLNMQTEHCEIDVVFFVFKFSFSQDERFDIKLKTGCTALHLACFQGHTECARLLVENGADLNMQTDYGSTALLLASWQGHVDIVRDLVGHGADAEKGNKNTVTPLGAACINGNTDIVQLLLRHNADVNASTWDGTPLHAACGGGHKEAVRVLLMQDTIDVNVKDSFCQTPLHVACNNGHTEIVRLLLEQKDIDVNAASEYDGSPLHVACGKGLTEIVQLLIQHHADVNIAWSGQTPWCVASIEGHHSVVELLLQYNADINKTDICGKTALHWACWHGHFDTAKLLIQNNADINKTDWCNKTALHVACENGHCDTVQLLLHNNADHTIKDGWVSTALNWTREKGHHDIVAMLEKLRSARKNKAVSNLHLVTTAK